MIFSNLPSPAEAGFAKAGNRFPLFRIMLWMENIVEQSLRELLALSAHDARSSLVSRRLPRPRRFDRRRRLQPLHARRARALARRGGIVVPELRRRERIGGAGTHLSDRRSGCVRHHLSLARIGARREFGAWLCARSAGA